MGSNHPTQYTVLARRFRPQSFQDVVGQEHVSQALRNAITSNRVAHSYLFTGARGVGKTSMARILAKALNCPQSDSGDPCHQCEICENIAAGSDVDVLEIDGASNRGIDDIRSLRANVNVKSMRTHYKMYIIDEVHMLTKEAFNALLKTLEEPPPNVIFVFCTTEPNKVPDTILSRCQRFDFSTIDTNSISERLLQIAEIEGVQVDSEAVELVARRAAGSMRDSQSIFDQLLAFGEDHLTANDVHTLLGTASDDRLVGLVDALQTGRQADVLVMLNQSLTEGVQLGEFVDQLIHYFRDLMVLAAGATEIQLMSVSETTRPELMRQIQIWDLHRILAGFQILSEAKSKMQRLRSAKALTEVSLIRISLLDNLDSLTDLIHAVRSGVAPQAIVQPKAAPLKLPVPVKPALQPQPTRTLEIPPSVPQKKTEKPVEQPQITEKVAEPQVETVEFSEANKSEIISQVLSQIEDTLKDHVGRHQGLAISEPNVLVLSFSKSYNFSKQYCQKPDSVQRLESLASGVCGKPIRIQFQTVEETELPEENEPAAQELSAQKTRKLEAGGDTFVQNALDVFEATIVKIDDVVAPRSNGEE